MSQLERAAAEQGEAAAQRFGDRAPERERKIEAVESGNLEQADSADRVAKRLDRLSRYYAGEKMPDTPAEMPKAEPDDVAAAAIERTAEEVSTEGPTQEASEAAAEAVADPGPTAAAAGVVLEKIINTEDFVDIRYLEGGVAAARAVCRVNIRNEAGRLGGYGSGSLVSPRLLLTNHHVLPSAEVAARSAAEFDYQDGLDGKPLQPQVFNLDPKAFFLADEKYDFALVAIAAEEEALAAFGFNRLIEAEGKAVVGEFVTIVQHPRGEKKQVSLRENRIVDLPEAFIHYEADTEPGSSGSPVFNDQWEVVALHHASVPAPDRKELGGYMNEGIRVSALLRFIAGQGLKGDAKGLVDQLVGGERIAVSAAGAPNEGRASLASPRPLVAAGNAGAVLHAALARGGSGEVTVPLEISVRVADGGDQATSAGIAGPVGAEATVIDPDWAGRGGYDPGFLGRGKQRVPLPTLSSPLEAKTATSTKPKRGRPKYELTYHHFSVVMNKERRLAFFVAVNIDGNLSINGDPVPREERWFYDPRIPEDEQTGNESYADRDGRKNPLDRGHLVRRLDPVWGTLAEATAANDDTFHWTNCSPQHEDFNQRRKEVLNWNTLEDYILRNADKENFKASVFSGPVFGDRDEEFADVRMPQQFWKVAVMVKEGGKLSATAYLLSQKDLIAGLEVEPAEFSYGEHGTFQERVRKVEELTGISFGELPDHDPKERQEASSEAVRITGPGDLVL